MKTLLGNITLILWLLFAAIPELSGLSATAPEPVKKAPPPAPKMEYPSHILLPWHTAEIVPDTRKKAEKALDQVSKKLSETWLTSPATFTEYLKKLSAKIPANSRLLSDNILVNGKNEANADKSSITLSPVWCSLTDQFLFFLNAVDTEKNILLASSHTVISKVDWERALKNKSLPTMLSDKMTSPLAEIEAKLKERKNPLEENALHIGFSLGVETTRADEGSSHCLNLLLSEKLSPKHTVSRTIGSEELAAIRFLLDREPALTRPTRTLITRWFYPISPTLHAKVKIRKIVRPTLPQFLTLKTTFAEAIMGGNIPPPLESNLKMQLSSSRDRVEFAIDPKIEEFLNVEEKSLSLAEKPKVIKIYKAWVYLDKGRAYGLNVDDRMVSVSKINTPVNGHVVAYFGPELNLKTEDGRPIHEGAILYIRKGQHDTYLGQDFSFDQKKFPSSLGMVPGH